MKKISVLAIILTFAIIFSACSASAPQPPSFSEDSSGGVKPTTTATPAPPRDGTVSPGTSDIADRLIVRNGDMTVMVEDIKNAIEQIGALAAQKQGWVVSSQVSPTGEGLYGYISIRVPADEFENTMSAIANLAVEVKSQSTSSRDVTQEYTDLNSRLTNLEATEQQYLEILKKATTVQDILNVQNALARTREDIEVTKGQIQYLEQTSSTSMITVNLQQSKLVVKINLSRTVANADETIRFSPDITGGFSPYSYAWDFGDKVTSSQVAPEHSYNSSGQFTVKVKVTDDRGNTATDERIITIAGGWNGGSVARTAWRALITFGRVLLNTIIWLGIWSFVWVPIGIGVYFLMRRKKTKKGK